MQHPAALTPQQLHGLMGSVNWPVFFARAAVRGVILWPIVHFIGGTGTLRSVATAAVGGVALSGIELAFDSAQAAAQLAVANGTQASSWFSPTSHMNGLGAGQPNVIDVPYTP